MNASLVDACGTEHQPVLATPRIVSLVPSLTELLFALDLGEQVVGRTGFCVHPKESIKRVTKVGGTKDVDIEKVRALAATHLIVNVDENRRELVDLLREFIPHVIVTHPLKPDDNLALYRMFGALFQRAEQAEQLCHDYQEAKAVIGTIDWPRQHVLYLIWCAPWYTISRETYISAMLALVGWESLPVSTSERYPQLNDTDPLWQQADLILLPSEPYRFNQRHFEALHSKVNKPCRLIDGEMISWYGSRAIQGLSYLARFRINEC